MIKRLIEKYYTNSEFGRNVFTMITGTSIAQAIPFFLYPVLTRLYTPEDFGVYSLYLSILNFLSLIVTLRYELAIVLPKYDYEALNILFLSIIICFLISLLSFLLIALFGREAAILSGNNKIYYLLYLIPLSLILEGTYRSFNLYAVREKKFKKMTKSVVTYNSLSSLSQILLSIIHGAGLVFGTIIGRFFSVLILSYEFFKDFKKNFQKINLSIIKEKIIEYKDFSIINSSHTISDVLKTSLSVILISRLYGSQVLGFYGLAVRVFQAPMFIIGNSLSQVLYQKLSALKKEEKSLYPIVKKIFIKITIISLPLFILLFFTAPFLFGIIFGDGWIIAGEYTKIISVYIFFYFLIYPFSKIPIILNKQKEYFFIDAAGSILFIGIIYFFKKYEFEYVLIILSVVTSIFYLYTIYWYYKILQKN